MRCQACNFNCECPRILHTGEGKVQVSLTAEEIAHLLGQGTSIDLLPLYRKLERALNLLQD